MLWSSWEKVSSYSMLRKLSLTVYGTQLVKVNERFSRLKLHFRTILELLNLTSKIPKCEYPIPSHTLPASLQLILFLLSTRHSLVRDGSFSTVDMCDSSLNLSNCWSRSFIGQIQLWQMAMIASFSRSSLHSDGRKDTLSANQGSICWSSAMTRWCHEID